MVLSADFNQTVFTGKLSVEDERLSGSIPPFLRGFAINILFMALHIILRLKDINVFSASAVRSCDDCFLLLFCFVALSF